MTLDGVLSFTLEPVEALGAGRVELSLIVSNVTDSLVSNLCFHLSGDRGLRVLGKDGGSGIVLGPRASNRIPLQLRVDPGERDLHLHSISLRLSGQSIRLPDAHLALKIHTGPVVDRPSAGTSREPGAAVEAITKPVHPFDAYSGRDPYLFVSYAHKDSLVVYPLISHLHSEGIRIWYDEGIEYGSSWPDAVARALDNAALFLVFISQNAVQSENVLDEINRAIEKIAKESLIPIHLNRTELPGGLGLRLGRRQAIFKYEMNADEFFRKLKRRLPEMLREVKSRDSSANAPHPPALL
jgi:hypothetical protein